MKNYGMIATMVLCACALVAGCGDEEPAQNANELKDPVREFLDKSDAAIERIDLPLAVAQKVSFKTDDNVEIFADYYPGKGENPAGVILVHDLFSSRREWDSLIDDLVAKGYAVLAFDLRDHGESTRKPSPAGHGPEPTLSPAELHKDFAAARGFVEKKGISNDKTVVITSGERTCEMLGTAHNCKGAICLSPNCCYNSERLPADWYYYFPTKLYPSAPGLPELPTGKGRVAREIKGESSNWMLIEVRAQNPAEAAAQKEIIRKRLEAMHVSGVSLRSKGDGIIQIVAPEAGHWNITALLNPCELEFKAEACNDFIPNKDVARPGPPGGYMIYELDGGDLILVEVAPFVTTGDFEAFYAAEDDRGNPVIGFRLRESAAEHFEDMVEGMEEDGRRLVVVLDNRILSVSDIKSAVKDGVGMISISDYRPSKIDYVRERDRLLASLQGGMLALEYEKLRTYLIASTRKHLIVSVKDGKAKTVMYNSGILGRKFGDFDVNENILRDIESILAKKEYTQPPLKPVAPSS